MVKPAHKKCHAASSVSKLDVISSIPKNLIAYILERMPIQDAVKTSILSRSWRFKWTMMTQLLLDQKFFEYLNENGLILKYGIIVTRALLHLDGPVTKFSLYIPHFCEMFSADISHWFQFLSKKGLKELAIINMHQEPRMLPSCFFSCLELKHLKLHNFRVHLTPGFSGFPKLVSFEFHHVSFETNRDPAGEFVVAFPQLEMLTIRDDNLIGNLLPSQINGLKILKYLSLSLCKLETLAITSSDIVIRLISSFVRLEELRLDFGKCKFLPEARSRESVTSAFDRLKILKLEGINFNCCHMVRCALGLIHCSPNLQELEITAMNEEIRLVLPLASDYWEEACTMKLLEIVKLDCIEGVENELSLIRFLLACSPLLKKMVINQQSLGTNVKHDQSFAIARKLLKFHINRASPLVEIFI